jgi:hypothetical protein
MSGPDAELAGAVEGDDLAAVLSDIGWGKLATTRSRLANSDATREFLEIGLDILQADLLSHTGPNFDEGIRSRMFESLSRERIMRRAVERDPDQNNIYSVNMFRHRWDRKDRYTEDLISYLFRMSPQMRHMAEMEMAADGLIGRVSFRELVQLLAAAEVESMINDPVATLQMILQSALPSHPKVRQFTHALYGELMRSWAGLYERVTKAYGLSLKPAYTWFDVALLFNAVIEGGLSRARIERKEGVLSDGTGVLAGAILAMLPALLEGFPEDASTLNASSARVSG